MNRLHKALKIAGILLFYLIVCYGCGAMLGRYATYITLDISEAMVLIVTGVLMVYLATPLQIILHEGGHMVMGLLTGYTLTSFNVFGVVWMRGGDGRVRVKRSHIAGAAGQCLMAPPDYDEGRFPVTLYNLGGVMVNLLTVIVCAPLAYVTRDIPVLCLFLTAMAFVGLLLAITNGLPMPGMVIRNDGQNQLSVRRSVLHRRAFWLQLAIASEMAKGKRLTGMPDEWFALPADAPDDALITTIEVLACSQLMESDRDAARAAITKLLNHRPCLTPLHRMLLNCDLATLELLSGETDGPGLHAIGGRQNRRLMQSMRKNPAILRTNLIVALLHEGDQAKSTKLRAAFDQAAKAHPYPQEIDGERALIALAETQFAAKAP